MGRHQRLSELLQARLGTCVGFPVGIAVDLFSVLCKSGSLHLFRSYVTAADFPTNGWVIELCCTLLLTFYIISLISFPIWHLSLHNSINYVFHDAFHLENVSTKS